MKVKELEGYLKTCPADAEVRLAHQPNYPLEFSLAEVVTVDVENDECPECKVPWYCHDDKGCEKRIPSEMEIPPVVYLTEGTQLGYLPGNAVRQIGWR